MTNSPHDGGRFGFFFHEKKIKKQGDPEKLTFFSNAITGSYLVFTPQASSTGTATSSRSSATSSSATSGSSSSTSTKATSSGTLAVSRSDMFALFATFGSGMIAVLAGGMYMR